MNKYTFHLNTLDFNFYEVIDFYVIIITSIVLILKLGLILSEVEEIIKDFEFLDSWEDKYQLIIDMGRSLPDLDKKYMTENYKLKGCQSTVHFVSYINKDKTLTFAANSDAFIVKGLIALLLKVFNNKSASQIIDIDLSFLKRIGLDQHLSISRKNGLSSMIDRIKYEAKLNL